MKINPLVIPIIALMIPIVALLGPEAAPLVWILAGVGGAGLVGRGLIKYRHDLRMEELDRRERIAQAESQQLRSAERILDLDDRPENVERRRGPPQTG